MFFKALFSFFLFIFSSFAALHDEWTLEQKAGQLLIAGYDGTGPDDGGVRAMQEHIKASRVGGVIAFARNVETVAQVGTLNALFSTSAAEANLLPPFICVDQEGGRVQRLKEKNGFPNTPSAKEIAAGSLEDAQTAYAAMAGNLVQAGFNWNFGPCVDLDIAGEEGLAIGKYGRSYGPDVDTVVNYAGAMIEAHRAAHCLPCVKHFPGHGSAKGDTHEGFVNVTDVWAERELDPFAQLGPRAGAVMTSHVVHTGLDPDGHPATLSAKILDMLREKCPEAIIVSDCMQMKGIQHTCASLEDAVVRALKAGVDQIIFANNPLKPEETCTPGFEPGPDFPERFVQIVMDAVADGRLTEAEVDAKIARIVALKRTLSQ